MIRSAASGVRNQVLILVPPDGQSLPRIELKIPLHAAFGLGALARQIGVEVWILARKRDRTWLAFIFPVGEEVYPVFYDRTSERSAELLVLVGDHPLLNEVGRVQIIVTEITGKCSGQSVGAGLGDGVHHHAHRAALGGIEPV